MTQTRARQILQSLIQGIDPITGEELQHETVLQQAEVLRALLAGLSALEQTAARAQRRAQLPDNVGQAWTTEEESRLVAAFKNGDSPASIARQHGRTLRAIEARLEKLGLITARERTTRGGFTGVSEAQPRPRGARGGILARRRQQRRSR
jgi:DNA-binding NarL/FixJ family response regulator